MRKFSKICLVLVGLLFSETTWWCLSDDSTLACKEEERQALLKFKHSLKDKSHRLSSWHSQDCCSWKGVYCDGITGHIIKLDLQFNVDTDTLEFNPESISNYQLEANEVDSCLLELKYLNYLDLSGNDFQGSPIPKFFGSMAQLRYLNLSVAHFSGMVPHHLSNLSSLSVLDLKSNDLYSGTGLLVDDLTWVSRLSSLQYLDMSGVDLSQSLNLQKVLNLLPSLLELRLSRCGIFHNIHLSSFMFVNSTVSNVEYLDLSHNSFEGEIPSSLLRNTTSLRLLDLSRNSFNSLNLYNLENLKILEHLNLADNDFNGSVGGLLRLLFNQCSLRSFDISANYFEGEIMSILYGNLSGCTTYNLETLNLADNSLTGHLPDWLSQLKHLKYLDLSFNSFHGPIPASLGQLSALENLALFNNELTGVIPPSLGKLSMLRELHLSDNQLNGTIPISFGQLSNLKLLDVSYNSLKGVITEAHFSKLSMLQELATDLNFLTLKVRSDWIPSFQLKSIRLRYCKIESQFPQWLQTQKKVLEYLDLSNASISGTLPEWLHDMHLLRELRLSHNYFSGTLPNFPSTLNHIDLSNNLISTIIPQNIGDMVPSLETLLLAGNLINGSIPNSLCQIITFEYLDLSKNRLSGNLPHCLGKLSRLWSLKFSSNNLTGIIPSSIGHLTQLNWLHLNNNSFYGEFPLLRNCKILMGLDVGENRLSGNIPRWIGEIQQLIFLRLHKNMLNGSVPSQLCQLQKLQVLDIADNNLIGTIPYCFDHLTGMIIGQPELHRYSLPWLEENMIQDMKGNDLEYGTTLRYLFNMDLSMNNLIGSIPEELTILHGLHGLNLSHNNLTGSIPKKIGGMTSLESLDFSSNQLSGTIPESMSALNFLSHLNLSYNNLSGRIPTGNQLRTLDDPSFYIGNNELCGAPLPRKCPGDEPSQPPTTTTDEEKNDGSDESEKVWFYLVIMSGYATGLWGVLGILLFKKNWRHALFRFVDQTKEKALVAIAVRMARLNGS